VEANVPDGNPEGGAGVTWLRNGVGRIEPAHQKGAGEETVGVFHMHTMSSWEDSVGIRNSIGGTRNWRRRLKSHRRPLLVLRGSNPGGGEGASVSGDIPLRGKRTDWKGLGEGRLAVGGDSLPTASQEDKRRFKGEKRGRWYI